MVGAVLGALAVQQVDPSVLRKLIPALLIAIAIYMLVKPDLGAMDVHPRMSRGWFDVIFGLGLGFYDGFLGPGTGTFWTMAFVLALGFNLTRATGSTKVMNFGSNISSLALFLWRGNVWYSAGLLMGVGQFLGARIGSRMVIARGTRFIRPIFLGVVLAITVKLLISAFSK
jgi:uncharacterized membrane protein YfcA